jgi:hypothetical protein
MDDDVIFVRRGEDLVPLAAAPYEAEDALQALLVSHPQLLADYQMSRNSPRRFLLVRREAPVPDRDGGAGRWSRDHLFLDQDAVPTLVEVKRSADTQIRREVVGQMLDYAANATRYWADGTLRQLFEETCAKSGQDPAMVLEDVIGPDGDVGAFWSQADRNLRGGALRLVFVADVIPDELRAVIEFLGARMSDTHVHGVEVRRYADRQGEECFVPRLVGAAAAAADRRLQTSVEDKMHAAAPDIAAIADRLRVLAAELGLVVREASASLRLCDRLGALVLLYPSYGTIEFRLGRLRRAGQEAEIERLRGAIQRVSGESRPVTAQYPNIGCREALANWDAVAQVARDLARLCAESPREGRK